MKTSLKALILIPSRYGSSRFPGKSLSIINKSGREITLVEEVYSNCLETGFDVAVVTDHDEIESTLKNSQMKVLRVDDLVESGTERIALAYQRFFEEKNYDLIINVQGDEPLLKKDDLIELAHFHAESSFDIATLVKKRNFDEDYNNPNVVKVARDQNQKCLYFSRSSIPYVRDEKKRKEVSWLQHIGVYSYKPDALHKFVNLKPSKLEMLECLEQLRALENHLTIGAIDTQSFLMGVDTPEDLVKLNRYLNQK